LKQKIAPSLNINLGNKIFLIETRKLFILLVYTACSCFNVIKEDALKPIRAGGAG